MKQNKIYRFVRSPWWPALLSGFVAPGLGQFANRNYLKAALLFTSTVGSSLWFSRIVTDQISLHLAGTPDEWIQNRPAFQAAFMKVGEENPALFVLFYLLLFTTWVFSIVDAYLDAKKFVSSKKFTENSEGGDA